MSTNPSNHRFNSAYFLVGPTASGKTDIAHHIARSRDWDVLSADSMVVYRHMDKGTAKPSSAMMQEVRYHGINLTDPDKGYTAGNYCEYARAVISNNMKIGRTTIVVGGTGLYIKALILGLDAPSVADAGRRLELDRIGKEDGITALLALLEKIDSSALKALKDKSNPRRIIRAIELAESGQGRDRKWADAVLPAVPCIAIDTAILNSRIETRGRAMFKNGLVDEARCLRRDFKDLSATALHAIGYAEAFKVLDGEMTEDAAIQSTIIRTRQLAKRQRTWFRNVQKVDYIDLTNITDVAAAAKIVDDYWQKHGSVQLL